MSSPKQAIERIEAIPNYRIEDDSGEHQWEPGPDEWECYGTLVREAYINSGYPAEPPDSLIRKPDALFYLKRASAWLDRQADNYVNTDGPLTVKQAALRFNIPARTIYDLCADGQLRHSRVGTGRGTIRIKPDDLEKLLAAPRRPSKPTSSLFD